LQDTAAGVRSQGDSLELGKFCIFAGASKVFIVVTLGSFLQERAKFLL